MPLLRGETIYQADLNKGLPLLQVLQHPLPRRQVQGAYGWIHGGTAGQCTGEPAV